MSQASDPVEQGAISEASPNNPPEVSIVQLETKDLQAAVVQWKDVDLPIDILLLTVKDCEFLSCLSYLNPGFFRSYETSLGYVYFREMGEGASKLKIAVIKCNMGSSVPKGSSVVVSNAGKILRPKAVFCVGYCGGLNQAKVKLGDVVISSKLITYAPTKVTEGGIIECGVRVPLNTRLADLTRYADHGWEAPLKEPGKLNVEVHKDGSYLSGPQVVKSNERREELMRRFPEATAIEMEGEGLYAAAHDLNVEWIVIKGVSDFAGDNKSATDSWRPFSSMMAASLTAHILLSNPAVFKEWPHCK